MGKRRGIDKTLREIVRESKRRKANGPEIRRLYRSGMCRREIAKKLSISYATVHRHSFAISKQED